MLKRSARPERRHTLCASLRSRKVLGDPTRVAVEKHFNNLQQQPFWKQTKNQSPQSQPRTQTNRQTDTHTHIRLRPLQAWQNSLKFLVFSKVLSNLCGSYVNSNQFDWGMLSFMWSSKDFNALVKLLCKSVLASAIKPVTISSWIMRKLHSHKSTRGAPTFLTCRDTKCPQFRWSSVQTLCSCHLDLRQGAQQISKRFIPWWHTPRIVNAL